MTDAHAKPVAIAAEAVPARTTSLYPEPFASMVAGRAKRALGDVFGLKNFGVNLTRLAPGSRSALRHATHRCGRNRVAGWHVRRVRRGQWRRAPTAQPRRQ
jgi:hypothetical protein